MAGLFYYLTTFAEAAASVFGIRGVYEQPRYAVLQTLPQVEVRLYDSCTAVEAVVSGTDRQQAAREAFNLLFRYITGENQGRQDIAMTAPVRTVSGGQAIAMTAPVQSVPEGDTVAMRFILPRSVAERGAPAPVDKQLRIVAVPQTIVATYRYSGVDNEERHEQAAARLLAALKGTMWQPVGAVSRLNYDPPFAIPFLRRNEAAVEVRQAASGAAAPDVNPVKPVAG